MMVVVVVVVVVMVMVMVMKAAPASPVPHPQSLAHCTQWSDVCSAGRPAASRTELLRRAAVRGAGRPGPVQRRRGPAAAMRRRFGCNIRRGFGCKAEGGVPAVQLLPLSLAGTRYGGGRGPQDAAVIVREIRL
jgi:hypothetical protein